MRPIDKGTTPGSFKKYEDAQQPLTERIGDYCSYCERWIASGIHVEHKKPKEEYPQDKLLWDNFLLSCGNCNSGKGHGEINLGDYIWPDCDNTFRAFEYDAEGRVLAKKPGGGLDGKIYRTWEMLGLNRHPDVHTPGMQKPTMKDKRWVHRREAWGLAIRLKQYLASSDTPEMRSNIANIAMQRGMFSIWMAVFSDDTDMRLRLIRVFPGTAKNCFDNMGQAVPRTVGQI